MSTYLYIKQHLITGKLYFGKTTKNPETYKGSGKYWKRHISEHGKDHVVNLWYHLFEDQVECTKFAIEFSNAMNIVESDQWLNLMAENGIDGRTPGSKLSTEHKAKISNSHKGKIVSAETKAKISKTHSGENHPYFGKAGPTLGTNLSEEHKAKISESRKLQGCTRPNFVQSEETKAKMRASQLLRWQLKKSKELFK